MNEEQHQQLIKDAGYPDDSYHQFLTKFVKDKKCRSIFELGIGNGSSMFAMIKGTALSKSKKKTFFAGLDIDSVSEDVSSAMSVVYQGVDSKEWLAFCIKDSQLDLVHFDAHHDFSSITNYLYSVLAMKKWPKYIIFHDWISPTLQEAVNSFIAQYPTMYRLTVIDGVFNGACVLTLHSQGKRVKPRRIALQVPPGIGDIMWIMQKLCNANLEIDLEISGEGPKRGLEFAKLFKFVKSTKWHSTGYNDLNKDRHSDQGNFEAPELEELYKLSANDHLISGKNITGYLPAYPACFDLEEMLELPKTFEGIGDHNVIVYPSSYNTNKHWPCGTAEQWWLYMEQVNEAYFKKHDVYPTFHITGATYDRKMALDITRLCEKTKMKVINVCGKYKIGHTLRMIQQADYVMAFPSGIGITSSMLGIRTLMFMPKNLKGLEYQWMRKGQTNLVHVQINDISNVNVGELLVNG